MIMKKKMMMTMVARGHPPRLPWPPSRPPCLTRGLRWLLACLHHRAAPLWGATCRRRWPPPAREGVQQVEVGADAGETPVGPKPIVVMRPAMEGGPAIAADGGETGGGSEVVAPCLDGARVEFDLVAAEGLHPEAMVTDGAALEVVAATNVAAQVNPGGVDARVETMAQASPTVIPDSCSGSKCPSASEGSRSSRVVRRRFAGPRPSLHPTPRKTLNAHTLRAMLARAGSSGRAVAGAGSLAGGVALASSPSAPGSAPPVDLAVVERSRFSSGLSPLCRSFVDSTDHLSCELKKEVEELLGALSAARRETIGHRERGDAAVAALDKL